MESWDHLIEIEQASSLFESDSKTVPTSGAAASEVSSHRRLLELVKAVHTPAQSSSSGERLSFAQKVLAFGDELLSRLDQSPAADTEAFLHGAILQEFLALFEAGHVFEGSESLPAAQALTGRCANLVSRWREQKILEKDPLDHLRESLGPLIEILNRVQALINDRLFVPPELDAAVAKDRKELAAKFADLKKREAELVEAWKKPEGREKDFAERAAQLFDERKVLETDQQKREAGYGKPGQIGLLDARRKSVFESFDKASIDADQVKQRKGFISLKLQSLDEELPKLEQRLPGACRQPDGSGINKLFHGLNHVLRLNGRKEGHPTLDQPELADFLFLRGSLYSEVMKDLLDLQTWLQNLLTEHEQQTRGLQEIRDLVKAGNVFLAEKRMAKLERKFKDLSYRRCDEAIQEGMKPFRDAQRLTTEVDEYAAKRKGFMAKLFKDSDTKQKLENRITTIRGEVGKLPKCEIKTAVLDLCQKLEAALR